MAGGFPQAAGVFRPGSKVGDYLLEEQVGQGGMAVVFRALDERLNRQVALKILAPALAGDEAFRQRFIRESRTAAAVDDPHIIPVFEAGEKDGVLFIAMRYVGGGDVRTLINGESPLDAARVAAIVSPVASALDAAHAAGLVHRDVKPANMLLDTRPGRPEHVYLSDFGLSKTALGTTELTSAGQVLGTVHYAAPEQLAGKPVDGRADQYALGCTAFEILSGEPPFSRDQPLAVVYAHLSEPPPRLSAKRPGLPGALDAIFARALAKEPNERYGSCTEFAKALRQASGLAPYGTGPSPAHPVTEVVPAGAVSGPTDQPLQADPSLPGPGPYAAPGQYASPGPYAAPGQYASPGPYAAQGQYAPGGQVAAPPYIPGLYPSGAQPPGAQPPGQYGPPPPVQYNPGRERRWPAIVVSAAILVVACAVAYAVIALPGHSQATSNRSPSTGASGGGSPQSHGSAHPSTGTGSSSTQSTQPQSPPQAWTTYTDPSGFSVKLPPGWFETSADRSGPYPVVNFGDPAGYTLLVSWSRKTGTTALPDLQDQVPGEEQAYPSYHLIRLENVPYRSYNAAVWEFTEVQDGELIHINDWNFVAIPGVLGYAIELKGPQSDWTAIYDSTWNGVLTSFKPAS